MRIGDTLQNRQQPEFLEARHLSFDITHGETKLAALLKKVRAEPTNARDKIGEVHLAFFVEPLARVFRYDLLHDTVHPLLGRNRRIDRDELAIDAEDDWGPYLKVDIRGVAVDGRAQNLVE